MHVNIGIARDCWETHLEVSLKPVVRQAIRSLADAGVRDEDVEAVELACELLREFVHLPQVREVDAAPCHRAIGVELLELLVDVGLRLVTLLLVRREDDDGRAGAGHGECGVVADACGCACDDGDTAFHVRDLVEAEAAAQKGRGLGGIRENVAKDGGHGGSVDVSYEAIVIRAEVRRRGASATAARVIYCSLSDVHHQRPTWR